MRKLTENSFRDVNIALTNELSIICEKLGINVWELVSLASRHPRVNMLQPCPGVGGHCITVDPWFIVSATPYETTHQAVERGQRQQGAMGFGSGSCGGRKVSAFTAKPVVACLGLAFKANIDDLRESPALEIFRALADIGKYEVLTVEPNFKELPESIARTVKLQCADAAIKRIDIVLLWCIVVTIALRSMSFGRGYLIPWPWKAIMR